MPQIEVNGTIIDYKEFGRGDKILISTQSFFFTDSHMELLGKAPYDYHVYLLTMRGYGQSGVVEEPYERDWTKVWGEDVLAFAEAVGAKQFYYSGVSHGCWAGWYIALHKPEVLRGFAATSGVVQFIPPSAKATFRPPVGANIDRLVGNSEELAKISWNTFYPTNDTVRLTRRKACQEEHLNILLHRRKEEFLVRNTNMSCCDVKSEEEFEERLARIPIPVLIVNGIRDDLSTIEKAIRVTSLIPGAQLIAYEHFEHAGPDECPQIVARDCDIFFRDAVDRVL